jgi:hypothetical protein
MPTESTKSGKSDETKELKSKEEECPHCRNYGPWNGVICMSCGYRFHE